MNTLQQSNQIKRDLVPSIQRFVYNAAIEISDLSQELSDYDELSEVLGRLQHIKSLMSKMNKA